eukprot:TRINITY_DN32644_c0_g1_i1.p1 TRINITY_DN32644_c0_g1~~TRINITY_DN32644_c0_g1_i1.p1  ORF type:complete len:641 (-),score=150.14 TRINITY_DN32644_c0_g1_i1:94-2016(-)
MGAGFVRALHAVVPSTEPGSAWVHKDVGPTLRRFFGAYTNGDVWAVYRRYKHLDVENSGWISYEELSEIVMLPEFNLVFIFDAFSKQNALIDSRELLTMVSLFSSATPSEKCQIFTTLFDASHSGVCTGQEVAGYAALCLQVLARCTGGAPVRQRDLAAALQEELPDLLPAYRDAVHHRGSDVTFREERIFARAELDTLLQTIREEYAALPIGQEPPEGAVAPPPPDWGHGAADQAQDSSYVPLNRRLTEQELAHMAVMGGLRDEEEDAAEAARKVREQRAADRAKAAEAEAAKAAIRPAKAWMLIHGADFDEVSKDLPKFRHTFIRSVAHSLDLPSGCVEIIDVTPGSVVVEFCVHQSSRKGDSRVAQELVLLLAEQLINGKSTFRRGHFAAYAASAELLTGPTRSTAAAPLGFFSDTIYCEQAVQFCNPQSVLDEVLARLDIETQRAQDAESKERKALQDLKKCDETVKALKDLIARAKREEAERKAEQERDEEMRQFGDELRLLEELRLKQEEGGYHEGGDAESHFMKAIEEQEKEHFEKLKGGGGVESVWVIYKESDPQFVQRNLEDGTYLKYMFGSKGALSSGKWSMKDGRYFEGGKEIGTLQGDHRGHHIEVGDLQYQPADAEYDGGVRQERLQ